ncbi:hypothetical protein Dda_6427 [Drechslerella dactyloides]|uniref:Gingipain domain-containing protein n=1 Tax=Drechslerella dactyloides TaxID=74499 RepID=A0AAD6IXT5_DREDA|nr:hypothetical protein Dda_6427 [Drechslerella dactyloides]
MVLFYETPSRLQPTFRKMKLERALASLVFLLIFIPASLAFPAGGSDDDDDMTDAASPGSASSLLGGILGWNAEVEENWSEDKLINVVVILKHEHWTDRRVINEIRVLFASILDPPKNADAGGDPGEGMYVPEIETFGVPWILVRAKYHKVAKVILRDFVTMDNERVRIGVSDYLETWGFINAEDDLFHNKMAPEEWEAFSGRDKNANTQLRPVDSVTVGSLRQNTAAITYPGNGMAAFEDFIYHSKPPDANFDDWKEEEVYWYPGTEGEGVDIWVLDSGLASSAHLSREFNQAFERRRIKGWFFAGGTMIKKLRVDSLWRMGDVHENYVGTKVIAKITGRLITEQLTFEVLADIAKSFILGRRNGYARKANVYIGVIYDYLGRTSPIYLVDVLMKTFENVKTGIERNSTYKAIVNIPSDVMAFHRIADELDMYTELTLTEKKYIDAYSRIASMVLKKFADFRDNVILVTGTGNGNRGWPIMNWPAKDGGTIPNLVVVGHANEKSRIGAWSAAPYVHVYANAEVYTFPLFGISEDRRAQVHLQRNGVWAYFPESGIDYGKLS